MSQVPPFRLPAFGTQRLGGAIYCGGEQRPCTQCGAPHEVGTQVCSYCLSPRAPVQRAPLGPEYHFLSVNEVREMRDESFRK